jgi:hypothetical protein
MTLRFVPVIGLPLYISGKYPEDLPIYVKQNLHASLGCVEKSPREAHMPAALVRDAWAGPHLSGFATWLVLIVIPTALALRYFLLLALRGSMTLLTVQLILFACTTSFMAAAAFVEPGVLVQFSEPDKGTPPSWIEQFPRASFCRFTRRVIDRRDHYCPWLGSTIGRRNYRWFLGFVLSADVYASFIALAPAAVRGMGCLLVSPSGASSVVCVPTQPRWAHTTETGMLIYGIVIVTLLTPFAAHHIHLTSINQTTGEHARRRFQGKTNPYDRGVLRNWLEVLRPPTTLVAASFADHVDPELAGSKPPKPGIAACRVPTTTQQCLGSSSPHRVSVPVVLAASVSTLTAVCLLGGAAVCAFDTGEAIINLASSIPGRAFVESNMTHGVNRVHFGLTGGSPSLPSMSLHDQGRAMFRRWRQGSNALRRSNRTGLRRHSLEL